MSNKIKTKLNSINLELRNLKASVLAGKREIASAIKYNGIETVHPYDESDNTYSTFAQLAQLIRKLKASNSMILEFQIPDTATTAYKRTVVLPMEFSTAGYGSHVTKMNNIAKEIINSATPALASYGIAMASLEDDDAYNPMIATEEDLANATPAEIVTFPDVDEEGGEESVDGDAVLDDGIFVDPMPSVEENIPYMLDVYGNECIDGEYIPTMNEITTYLSEEQQVEILTAMAELGITTEEGESEANLAAVPMMASYGVAAASAEVVNEANYEFVVNWGDGSDPCEFHSGDTYENNKAAIWHTYDAPGIYDVTITGNFRRMYGNETSTSALVENGQNIKDIDNVNVLSGLNYAMRYYLISVISWGNTLLTNLNRAFCYCEKLATIPMYDTSNSFEDVTDCQYIFYRCSSLTQIPFNSNTNKGLFSGCSKVTNFASAFSYCTGMTGAIPTKLFDGCSSVTSLAGCFAYSRFTGAIPNGILDGMTSLTNASEMFASCQLTGQLSTNLFAGCPNITSIYRLFYGCTGVTGTIQREFIGGLSKLTDMRQAFYGCTGITGIAADAFYNLKANNINCRQAFYGCTGITSIPVGLLEEMTGKNLMMEKMFDRCTGITSISMNAVKDLKVANARGMFGGCTNMTTILTPDGYAGDTPDFLVENTDWATFDYMEKWYGAFARTGLDATKFCKELGGSAARRFVNGNVGKIVLQDDSLVEVEDYTYNASNKPIGWVYADVYLDPVNMTGLLANGAGNVVARESADAVHKLFIAPWSDTTRTWVDAQTHAEDITTITNTSSTGVAYNTWTWNEDGTAQTRNTTRYNGEAYSLALLKFIFEKGSNDYVQGVTDDTYTSYSVVTTLPTSGLVGTNLYFIKDESDDFIYHAYKVTGSTLTAEASRDVNLHNITSSRYPAITYCNGYVTNGISAGRCFLQDATDGWDLWVMREWMQKACQKVIAGGGGFTSSNCFPYRDGTYYWASSEFSSTISWYCRTDYSGVGYWSNEWTSLYVRPSLAINL